MRYIPLFDCKHGWLYKIDSRNLTFGVYREDKKGFVGIREKFGHYYLFVEYHWDTGEPYGTVKPVKCLEQRPVQNLNEYLSIEKGRYEENNQLFDWLVTKEAIAGNIIDKTVPANVFVFGRNYRNKQRTNNN